jgi:peptide deformylase
MLLKVAKYGEKILREKTSKVEEVTDELRKLSDDMLETMYHTKGVGLASTQVFRQERFCVIDVPSDCEDGMDCQFNLPIRMPLKMWNPEIIQRVGSVTDKEGCLSFPGLSGYVTRAEQVTCTYLDEFNKTQTITARGFLARAIQHEVDHLDGMVYIDRLSAVERLSLAKKLKRLCKENGSVR